MEVYLKTRINEEELRNLSRNAKDYALLHGIGMRVKDIPLDAVVPLSCTLLPSPFPEYWFDYAKSIQIDLNAVIHNVAYDDEFLIKSLKSTVTVDEFTAKLFEIYQTVLQEGTNQGISLGLLRSDYLLNMKENEKDLGLKQVEINTIASSFGGLCPKLQTLHQYILGCLKIKTSENALPCNPATEELAKGFYLAWETYGNINAVLLFIVEEITYNICDQRALEFCISEKYSHKVVVLRHKFSELYNTVSVKNGKLFVQDFEVAVVYYRTGYDPSQYNAKDWEIRLLIEKSKAIKCPSIRYHLAGTKKIQQELTKPGILEKFLPNLSSASKIREIFANQYSLDMNEDGNKVIKMALETPEKFVLKPQREGGGHNVYGKNVKKVLEEISSSKEREGYILMELINSPSVENYIIQWNKDAIPCQVICELGIFGVILGSKDSILHNFDAGYILRSKTVDSNETGIAAGFGALDTPFLN
ncbi:glutathione synthetase-like isoform X2 [Centruroides vittatus]|uniref:glutathione synthetase-like isoform X2 n=1 Tax=Centruroides vittatus TaxID=120091 RepID=UPI00350EC4DF